MDSEFDSLLRMIRERPADDLARLVFADWLQERSDSMEGDSGSRLLSWADYIRSAIRCHNRPSSDPYIWETVPAHLRLEPFAALELLPEWLRKCVGFRRGFPESVELSCANISASLELLADNPLPIRRLILSRGGRIRPDMLDLEAIRRFDAFGLVLHHPAGSRFLQAILHSRHVHRVRSLGLPGGFSGGDRGLEVARSIAMSPKFDGLEELDMSFSWRESFDLEPILRSPSMSRLTTLRLEGRNLTDAEADLLTSSPQMHRLETLVCNSPSQTSLFLTRVGAGALPALKSLTIADQGRSIPGLASFLSSPAIDRLEKLDVLHIGMVNPDVWDHVRDRVDTGHLDWEYRAGRPLDLEQMCRSPFLGRCHSATVGRWEASESILLSLARSSYASNLRSLCVRHSGPLDVPVPEEFARSPHLAGLLLLTIGVSGYSEPMLERLADASFAPTLRSLRIERGSFTSAALIRIFGDPDRFPMLMDLRLPTPIDGGREAILRLDERYTRVEFS